MLARDTPRYYPRDHDREDTVNLDLSTDAPPCPERTLQLAEAFAEVTRVLNHQTRHHEALRYPAEADRFLREVTSAVSRLDQLLAQAGGWLEAEREAGRIEVTGGPFGGDPGMAVVRGRLSLDQARVHLSEAVTALEAATSVTWCMAAAETGEGSSDEH